MRVRATFAVLIAAAIVLSGTSTAVATFPGDNGEIAYSRYTISGGGATGRFALATVQPDGTPGRVLFPSKRRPIALDAEWSPDGSTLAAHVVGGRAQFERIILVDVDSGDRSLVTFLKDIPGALGIYSIGFAPTGNALVICTAKGPSTRLHTIGTDGSNLTLVSSKPDCYADWSSTNRIVATRGNAYHNVQRIVTMDPDDSSTEVAVEATGEGLGEGRAVAPSWSPDGSRFVYSAQRSGRGQFDLYLVQADGNGRDRLTHTPRRSEYAPLFSPDAMTVAFVKTQGRLFSGRAPVDVFSVEVGGTNRKRLTHTAERDELTRSWQALIL